MLCFYESQRFIIMFMMSLQCIMSVASWIHVWFMSDPFCYYSPIYANISEVIFSWGLPINILYAMRFSYHHSNYMSLPFRPNPCFNFFSSCIAMKVPKNFTLHRTSFVLTLTVLIGSDFASVRKINLKMFMLVVWGILNLTVSKSEHVDGVNKFYGIDPCYIINISRSAATHSLARAHAHTHTHPL
jgi:hypothetical protein